MTQTRTHAAQLCAQCGYDLQAHVPNTDAANTHVQTTCPECGWQGVVAPVSGRTRKPWLELLLFLLMAAVLFFGSVAVVMAAFWGHLTA